MADLDGVNAARQSLGMLGPNDPSRMSALNVLASSLMSRFARLGCVEDLDEGVACTKQVLDLAPPGHSFHAAALSNMGQALSKQFKFRADVSILTDAIGYFEAAVATCTPAHSLYLPFVGNLCSGLLNRYWVYGDVKDLDRIIESGSTALSVSPAESQNRDSLFNNLATAFKERFAKQGNRADLDMALTHYHSCLLLRSPDHPLRQSVLGNLADAVFLRFEIDGHLQDLESASSFYASALQLLSPGQEGYVSHLIGLGVVYWHFFHVEGKVETLERAIGCYQEAMKYSKMPNLDHSRLLDNYGATLQSRYTLLGEVDDLDQAIQYLTTSSDILPPTYYGLPITHLNLGLALLNRFNEIGDISDLDSSIEKLASALQLCAPGHHQRPAVLSAYAYSLSMRFNTRGNVQDLTLATTMCKDALTLSSPTEPNHVSIVANLSSVLLTRFYKSGDIEECRTVIDHCDRVLVTARPGEPNFVTLKINRARALLHKFQLEREENDITACIDALRELIPTVSKGRTDHVSVHLYLGMALEARFSNNTDKRDLDESVTLCRVAHRSCRRGSSRYALVCMQLANALRESFEYHHDADALDEAIVLLAEADELLSSVPGHIDHKLILFNLGVALSVRFQAQKSRGDLDSAIEHVSHALTLPARSEEFLVPFTLATILCIRYTEDEDMKDLERCIELFGIAAEQMPPKHLIRSTLCRNYGSALVKLGGLRDHLQNYNAAVTLYMDALQNLPPSHRDHIQTCLRLADVLHFRALLLRDDNDLHSAIKLIQGIIEVLPEDGPTRHFACHSAALLFMAMHTLSRERAHMEDGFLYFQKAARYTYARSFTSVDVALEWARHAKKLHHSSALLAYRTSLGSLSQHLLAIASIKSRHAALLDKQWFKETGTLATDATTCAIGQGDLELAIELSEQGRGLLWSQLSQSRTPLDALRSAGEVGRALASDFERVSAQLAESTVAPDDPHAIETASRLATEEAARRYRQLSKELEDIIAHIRSQEGFQSFLDRPSFESLRHAAVGGPVILVNVSDQRCDAVIVLHDAPPRLVPLPETSLEELTTLSVRYYRMLQATSRVGEERMREREIAVALRTLWDTIVGPIVDELAPLAPRGARIWWCPTSKLTTLPLHAAGPYRKGGLNLPNIYVSSYTPTLTALIRARRRSSSPPTSPTSTPAFIAIGQANPASSTGPALQTVSAELSLVRSLLPHSPPSDPFSFSALDGEASTADAALAALATHGWVHLACHGYPNVERPFDAAFALRDRLMTVLDIVRARGVGHVQVQARNAMPEKGQGRHEASSPGPDPGRGPGTETETDPDATPGEFAFLSACHTAVGDRNAPDEIIHLASAMQFVGFRSVIGTMWAVDDGMARYMVRAFYECMFGGEALGMWDCTRAARALNRATKMVDKERVSLDQRIVFVHIGA